MPPDDAAVDLPDLPPARDIFALVGDIPRHPCEVLGPRAAGAQHGDDVGERLLDLGDEIVALELAARVPADLSGHEDGAPPGGNAVRVASRPRPAFRLEHFELG